MDVRQVDGAVTRPLRTTVLRDGRAEALAPDLPDTQFLGAYDDGVLVATGNIRLEPLDGADGWWRIRGMASDPAHRGRGAGTVVLDALLAHARAEGAVGVWCNARTPARTLYERAGFTVVGDEWDDPEIGPHLRMVLTF